MAIFTKYPTKSKERMGKGKPRNGTDPVPEHKDVLKRMNFLFQAAHLLNLSGPSTYVPTAGHSGSSHTRPTTGLSRYYSGLSKKIGQKVVLRMDPHVKRSLCKACDSVLIPGLTSRIQVQEAGKQPLVVTICTTCLNDKTLLADGSKTLFTDQFESKSYP